MAYLQKFPLLALFPVLLLPMIALGDDPLSPLYGAICDNVECGKGKCVGNITYPLGYVCECESGWARSSDSDVNQYHRFLPCVIPQCTLNYNGCQPAPPPAPPAKSIPLNASAYDPCYWMFCGEGSCTRNSTYNYDCTCSSGFYNLLNISYFPCYSPCTIGSDCSRLGIQVSKQSSTPGSSGSSSSNPANSILPEKFQWMITLLVPIIMFLCK